MKEKNKLDKSFGPVGSSAGIFLFIAGIIYLYFSLAGILLILFGAFFGFTHSSAIIDYSGKRIKFSNTLFGLIDTGKWIEIQPYMRLSCRKTHTGWRAYSRGNRTLDIENFDYRLFLIDSDRKEIMPLKKLRNQDTALQELEIFCNKLNLQKC